MLKALAIIAVIAAPMPAFGQVVSERADSVSIVIYPQADFGGLVMVTERRTVDLPAGPVRVEFRGVADGLIPQTAAVEGLPGGVREQNFDFNLLTPGSLISRSAGRTVRRVRTDPATGHVTEEAARIVSAGQGTVLDIGGRIEALKCSHLPERLVFDKLPEGLGERPSLSVETLLPQAGRKTLMLSYLATGVSWQANYVATLGPESGRMSLEAWITISNDSDATFAHAPVQVLAGTLNLTDETEPPEVEGNYLDTSCWPDPNWSPSPAMLRQAERLGLVMDMIPAADEATYVEEVVITGSLIRAQDLGDYKLYSLPGRTTVAANQSKQVRMFALGDVPVDRRYRFEFGSLDGGQKDPVPAQLVLVAKNTEAGGLGVPLPRGGVTVFTPIGGGRRGLAGEAQIRDIGTGLPVEFALEEEGAPLVQARTRILREGDTGGLLSVDVETVLTNAHNGPVIVQLREEGLWQDFAVSRASRPHHMKDGNAQWEIEVAANASVVLTYSLRGRN